MIIKNSYNKKISGKLIIDPNKPLSSKDRAALIKMLTGSEKPELPK